METRSLYDSDFYAWTKSQAASLRRLAEEKWNAPLDLEHLAEEVEALGRAERNAGRSQLRRIIEHRLKLAHSPAIWPRQVWQSVILDAQAKLDDVLTASLRRELENDLDKLYAQASRRRCLLSRRTTTPRLCRPSAPTRSM